jgi:hypothetical protein
MVDGAPDPGQTGATLLEVSMHFFSGWMVGACVVASLVSVACGDESDPAATSNSAGSAISCSGGETSDGLEAGMQTCERAWDGCSDGYTYGVRCSGEEGAWSCECLYNGPAIKTFESATLCELNSDKALIEEANQVCGWDLRAD